MPKNIKMRLFASNVDQNEKEDLLDKLSSYTDKKHTRIRKRPNGNWDIYLDEETWAFLKHEY